MLRHMRTTVRLDSALLELAKKEAAERNQTLTSLIEQGLRLVLARRQPGAQRERVMLPQSNARGGVLPGVDLDDSASLLDIAEGRR